jgi:hypothetical protein
MQKTNKLIDANVAGKIKKLKLRKLNLRESFGYD